MCIMFLVENACWDYDTDELKLIKSLADNLKRSWVLCDNRWAASSHLFATLQHPLFNPERLEFMQIPMGRSSKATKTLHSALTLAGKLAWTMSKCSAPFDCYSNILRPGGGYAQSR